MLYSGSTKRSFAVFESSKNVFAAKQDQKTYFRKDSIIFLLKWEVGTIAGAGSWNENLRMIPSHSLHELFMILITSHDAENAQKCYKEIKHIKVQCKGG